MNHHSYTFLSKILRQNQDCDCWAHEHPSTNQTKGELSWGQTTEREEDQNRKRPSLTCQQQPRWVKWQTVQWSFIPKGHEAGAEEEEGQMAVMQGETLGSRWRSSGSWWSSEGRMRCRRSRTAMETQRGSARDYSPAPLMVSRHRRTNGWMS